MMGVSLSSLRRAVQKMRWRQYASIRGVRGGQQREGLSNFSSRLALIGSHRLRPAQRSHPTSPPRGGQALQACMATKRPSNAHSG